MVCPPLGSGCARSQVSSTCTCSGASNEVGRGGTGTIAHHPGGVCPALPSGTVRAVWCQHSKPHCLAVFAPIGSSSEDLRPAVSRGETPREQPWILGWDELFPMGSHRGRRNLCRGWQSLPLLCDSPLSGWAGAGSCPLAQGLGASACPHRQLCKH